VGAARKVVSESRERTFDYDVRDFERLRQELRAMTERLCESLAAHERRGRTIGIKVRLDDWTTITRSRSVAEPTCELDTVSAVAQRLLAENAPQRPVRLLGVRVAGLTHREPERAMPQDAGNTDGGAPQMALPV
jgi:DNA polymerase-4